MSVEGSLQMARGRRTKRHPQKLENLRAGREQTELPKGLRAGDMIGKSRGIRTVLLGLRSPALQRGCLDLTFKTLKASAEEQQTTAAANPTPGKLG